MHIFLILICTLTTVQGVFEENFVMGQPNVICDQDSINLEFRTKKPFTGKIYVKGHYNRPECKVDYSDGDAAKGGIRLNHGACDMDRQRMITPDGMMFSTVLVISFHPLFITKVDRAFHVKCLYREAQRTVTQQLDVSALPTEALSHDMAMPICSYSIRKDTLDGEILKFARVGDQVVHRWECDSDAYGLLVHSCYVEDGQGETQLIVDKDGCHTDRLLLGDPTYVEALNMAYRESFVFKFADRVAVRFKCEIRLCLKQDGGCDGVTPPVCFDSQRRHVSEGGVVDNRVGNATETEARRVRRASSYGAGHSTLSPSNTSHATIDGDLLTHIYVLDADEEGKDAASALSSSSHPVCLSPSALLILTTMMTVMLVALASTAGYMACKQCRSNTADKMDLIYGQRSL